MKTRKTALLWLPILLIGLGACSTPGSIQTPASAVTISSGSASIGSVSPTSAIAGGPDLTVTITGSYFDGTGVIQSMAAWIVNGSTSALSTTFIDAKHLTAVIPAALLTSPVKAQVAVQHYDRIEGVVDGTSNLVTFLVISSVAGNSAGFVLAANMTTARSGHTATLLPTGKVLVAGGNGTAELFDPGTESFTPTGSMTTSRYGATATLLPNGKVLIAGGFGPGAGELPRLNSAELYDPVSGTFNVTGDMAVRRVLHTATLMGDGKVLISGGTDRSGGGGGAVESAELYDPATGTFSTTGSMGSERADHTATLLANGQVLIVGGWNGHGADAPDDPPWDPLFAELFDPSAGTFTTTGSMSTTRIGHSATRLASGKVLVLGGIPDPQNLHQPVNPQYIELYDPASHTFSSAGNLTISRTGYSATLLTNGKMLLAGGENLGRTVDTVELLDPTSDSLIATRSLVTARVGHTATLLGDGRVLVTGGVDSSGNSLASAELYK